MTDICNRGPAFRVAIALLVATTLTLGFAGCNSSGTNGVAPGAVFVVAVDPRVSGNNGAQVSILETQNQRLRIDFNTQVQAKTFFAYDAAGNLTNIPITQVFANIGGQVFDSQDGFLVADVFPTTGGTTRMEFRIGFNGGNVMPYDATITVVIPPEIRLFDPLDITQGDTADTLVGDPTLGQQFSFFFTTEHDTVVINEIMAVDNNLADGAARPDFVEIFNGTSETVLLDQYWLSHSGTDAQGTSFLVQASRQYFSVVTQPGVIASGNIGAPTDDTAIFDIPGGNNIAGQPEFTVRFPSGANVAKGQRVVVAADADDFFLAFARDATFGIRNQARANVDNMLALPDVVDGGSIGTPGAVRQQSTDALPELDDASGLVALFFLVHVDTTGGFNVGAGTGNPSGTFPIVTGGIVRQPCEVTEPDLQDVDLVVYGDRIANSPGDEPAIDKTGTTVELVGAIGTTVTFANDTARANQVSVPPVLVGVVQQAHGVGNSIARIGQFEFVSFTAVTSEFFTNGNGLTNANPNNKFPATAGKFRIDPTTGLAINGDERHNETSEILNQTFSTAGLASPGA